MCLIKLDFNSMSKKGDTFPLSISPKYFDKVSLSWAILKFENFLLAFLSKFVTFVPFFIHWVENSGIE